MGAQLAAVWMDHHEARIFRTVAGRFDESTVVAHDKRLHPHPTGPKGDHNHPDDAHRFFREVAHALISADSVLVVGPSTAKREFFAYLHEHERALEPKVAHIETVDHPTDAQVVALAKRYFRIPTRLTL